MALISFARQGLGGCSEEDSTQHDVVYALLLFVWFLLQRPLLPATKPSQGTTHLFYHDSVRALTRLNLLVSWTGPHQLTPQKDDDWSPFLSGLLSGSAMLCEQDERRTELLSFAMPRFAEVVWGLAEKRGYVRTIPYGAPLLFALALVRALSPPTLPQTCVSRNHCTHSTRSCARTGSGDARVSPRASEPEASLPHFHQARVHALIAARAVHGADHDRSQSRSRSLHGHDRASIRGEGGLLRGELQPPCRRARPTTMTRNENSARFA